MTEELRKKVTFQMPEGIHRRLKAQAALRGATIQEVLEKLAIAYVEKREREASE